jgi:hypothetical protein
VSRRDDQEARATLIGMVSVLAGFKIVTSLLILVIFPSFEVALVIIGLSIFWLAVGAWWAVSHAETPARLLRARVRRRQLVRQEWHID